MQFINRILSRFRRIEEPISTARTLDGAYQMLKALIDAHGADSTIVRQQRSYVRFLEQEQSAKNA